MGPTEKLSLKFDLLLIFVEQFEEANKKFHAQLEMVDNPNFLDELKHKVENEAEAHPELKSVIDKINQRITSLKIIS